MKAVLCKAWGPPESLVVEELPPLTAGPGRVVVSVKAAGVNFPDTLIIQNKYQHKPPLPFSPGSEVAGVVKQVGDGVAGWQVGDRVIAQTTYGGFAEEVLAEPDQLIALPEGMDFPAAATLGLAYFPSEKSAIELDVERFGWSEQQGIAVLFPINPPFSRTLQGAYEDAFAYRLGMRFGLGKGIQVRLGYAFEETPQPDGSVGPFLPEANRSVFSLGIGRDWLDIGVQLVAPENRITRTNADNLNGAYSGNSWMLGISVTK